MMYKEHLIVDVSGERKKNLTVPELPELFNHASGSEVVNDKLLLS